MTQHHGGGMRIAVLALALVPGAAFGQSSDRASETAIGAVAVPSTAVDAAEPSAGGGAMAANCKGASRLAESIMRARFTMPMSDQMDFAAKADPAIREMTQSMVVMAYGEPSYQTQEMQGRAVTEFGNRVYLACFK